MIRIFDTFLSLAGLFLLSPLLLVIYFVGWFINRSPIFVQQRVGRNQKPFILVKFRTMHLNTQSVATHLVDASANTTFGNFLRRTKLDELPQLWNVLQGDMSLVGPRPCLLNQSEVIAERAALGVFNFSPGITGLSQVRGIDMSTPLLLAKTDAQMLKELNIFKYFKYIFLTIIGRGSGDRARKTL